MEEKEVLFAYLKDGITFYTPCEYFAIHRAAKLGGDCYWEIQEDVKYKIMIDG
jgi:hypothetical protein